MRTATDDGIIGEFGVVVCAADLIAPFSDLTIDDVLVFLNGFLTNEAISDLAEPSGVWDIDDVLVFLAAFSGGCP